MSVGEFKISFGKFFRDSKVVHLDDNDWLILNALVKLQLIEDYEQYTFVYDGLYGIEECFLCEYKHLKIIELS